MSNPPRGWERCGPEAIPSQGWQEPTPEERAEDAEAFVAGIVGRLETWTVHAFVEGSGADKRDDRTLVIMRDGDMIEIPLDAVEWLIEEARR